MARDVGDAQAQVLDVVDGVVQEHRHVVVIQAVDDAHAGPGTGDRVEVEATGRPENAGELAVPESAVCETVLTEAW